MRSHGWSGNTPASDEEAIDRILNAVGSLVAEGGSSIRITDVARRLGVSRQTVYRYFPGTEALLFASRMRSADGFLDRLAAHVRGWNDPVAALVEGVAFAVENLAGDHQLKQLMEARQEADTIVSSTSELALAFGRSMLHRYDVDWVHHRFDDAGLDELAEISVRTVHSLLIDPGQPPRDPSTLRRFVARWLGPAILYPQMTRAIEALDVARHITAGVD
jgi:AcrR family transcriptional regulator